MSDQMIAGQPQTLEMESEKMKSAYADFTDSYQRQYPMPPRPVVVNLKTIGGMFWFYVLQSAAAILLGSMRTADMFFKVATASGTGFLAYVEAGSAVFAIEGGMVVYAAAKAIKTKTVNTRWITSALIFMFLVSAVAGLGQSLVVVKNIDAEFDKWFQYALAILLGAGSSVVVYVAGEVLGGQIVEVLNDYQTRLRKYDKDVRVYIETMNRKWPTSMQYKIASGGMKKLVQEVRFGSGSSSITHNRTEQNRTAMPRKPARQTGRIFSYMDKKWAEVHQVATVSELVVALQIAKSTASEIRKKWIELHSVDLAMVEQIGKSRAEDN